MNKKNLIACLAGLGLIVMNSSCEKDELNQGQKEGQDVLSGSASNKIGFTPLYELELPDDVLNQLVALSSLSNDIFKDPSVAQSFSSDPKKYLASIGMPSNALDINSLEVKAVLALGDKEVREAINNNDLTRFVKLLDAKGYLSVNKMSTKSSLEINDRLQGYLIQSFKEIPELQGYVKNFESLANSKSKSKSSVSSVNPDSGESIDAIFVAIVAVYVLVVVHSQLGVSYNVVAVLNVGVGVNIAVETNVTVSGVDESSINMNNPVLKIYGLETQTNDIYVANAYVEQTLDQIVDMTKQLEISRDVRSVMSDQVLRESLRAPVTQRMIDLGMF